MNIWMNNNSGGFYERRLVFMGETPNGGGGEHGTFEYFNKFNVKRKVAEDLGKLKYEIEDIDNEYIQVKKHEKHKSKEGKRDVFNKKNKAKVKNTSDDLNYSIDTNPTALEKSKNSSLPDGYRYNDVEDGSGDKDKSSVEENSYSENTINNLMTPLENYNKLKISELKERQGNLQREVNELYNDKGGEEVGLFEDNYFTDVEDAPNYAYQKYKTAYDRWKSNQTDENKELYLVARSELNAIVNGTNNYFSKLKQKINTLNTSYKNQFKDLLKKYSLPKSVGNKDFFYGDDRLTKPVINKYFLMKQEAKIKNKNFKSKKDVSNFLTSNFNKIPKKVFGDYSTLKLELKDWDSTQLYFFNENSILKQINAMILLNNMHMFSDEFKQLKLAYKKDFDEDIKNINQNYKDTGSFDTTNTAPVEK